MKPISIDTAVGLANSFASLSKGETGHYEVTDGDVRYRIDSIQNQLQNGPIVTFTVQYTERNRWVDRISIPDVNAMFLTDSFTVQSEDVYIRFLFKAPEPPTDRYTVPPVPPAQPIPPSPPEVTTARFQP